jgi:signal transduction histidine kinase
VQALVARPLEAAQIEWRVSPSPGLQILADPDQMVQVFLNLALNAIEAITAGGSQPQEHGPGLISVSFDATEPGRLGIRMADSGPGIDPQFAPHLFSPLATNKPGGLGIGLSICTDILRAHGGRLAFDSFPGEGAAFTAWLPQPGGDTL